MVVVIAWLIHATLLTKQYMLCPQRFQYHQGGETQQSAVALPFFMMLWRDPRAGNGTGASTTREGSGTLRLGRLASRELKLRNADTNARKQFRDQNQ